MKFTTEKQWDSFVKKNLKTKKKIKWRKSKIIISPRLQGRNNQYRQELMQKMTQSEADMGYHLARHGVPFMFQKGFFWPFHRIVDFYIPKIKTIIEVDGPYHLDPKIEEKDKSKDEKFEKERGFRTMRFDNSMVNIKEAEEIYEILGSYFK